MSKGDPIPTRFDPPEQDSIDLLQQRTGLSQAEIIRRAVRLLRKRYEQEGSTGFIVEELSPEYRVTRRVLHSGGIKHAAKVAAISSSGSGETMAKPRGAARQKSSKIK